MKRILSLFVLNLFFISGLWEQQTSVNGTVTDESGLPLPGATIIVENSNRTVTIDFDGNFTINAQAGEVLIVSYVGYQDNRVTVGNETSYTISLQTDAALEEVIVMGYASQNKSEITGSAKQVNSEEISQFPVTSPDQVLQGKVAGLSLSSPSGIPGTVHNILIRGRSSITSSNTPLFVIDGVPVESGGLQRSTARSTLTPLATLSPEDIQSITVLKDPSSTAPYGARGTNGVIVITTKKGKSGKTTLNFSSTYGFQNDAVEGPEMLIGAEREMLFYESLYNSFGASEGFTRDQAGEFYRNNSRRFGSVYTTWNENGRKETRWADYITNKDAPLQTYDFSARGSNEKTNFSISSGYVKQEATVIGSTFERFTGGISLQTELVPDLTFSTRTTLGYVEQDAVLEQSAYFTGALAHFDLLRQYGPQYAGGGTLGVPYVTTFRGDDLIPARNTVAEVKEAIYNDLDQAYNLMSSSDSADKQYPSKFAAKAIESRLALYFKEWSRASEAAHTVINSGQYTIASASSFVKSFAVDNASNSIFELAFSNIDNVGINGLGYIYRGNNYGDIEVLPLILDLYEEGDVRADVLGYEGKLLRNMGKYPELQGFDNISLIRIEEIVLNNAEALFEQGQVGAAIAELNKITTARNASPYEGSITKADILNERRKELIFEGFRFFDLSRSGLPIPKVSPLQNIETTIPAGDFRYALPIPQPETDANSNIEQNQGY